MRKRNWLLGLGLMAAAAWSVAVSAAMPSWFDPSEDCAHTAGRSEVTYPSGSSERSIDIETSWFPPRATCDFGGDRVYDFISPAKSVTLTVIGVLIALMVAVGLVVFAALASAIDRAYGPLPSTAAHSRRRGTVAAVITLLVVVLIVARTFPIPTLWPALLGATTYAVVVAVQWSRPGRLPALPSAPQFGPPLSPARRRLRTDRQDVVDQETGRHA